MNLGQLIGLARSPVHLDDAAEPFLWSDEVLTDLFNDAVGQHCKRARALAESLSPDICQYTLQANQRHVRLHPAILAVRTARLEYQNDQLCRPLQGRTLRWMTRHCRHWEATCCGRPHFWIPDWQEGCLALDRPIESAATLHLTVWRMPIEIERLDVADTDGEPVVAEHWHEDLVDWVVYRAMNGTDSDARNEQKAATAFATYEAKVGRLPSATEIRLWGVSPIVGTTPQYL